MFRTLCSSSVVAATFLVVTAAHADGAPVDAMAYLKKCDDIMSPKFFEADKRMTAHRADGTTRSYKMHALKAGADKVRATFLEPANAKGQEMLRNGENLWVYI